MPDRRILLILEYLAREWNQHVCVSQLAARVGVGPSRLQALFKADTLTSIRHYLQELRLARAAELIACTNERVSQIAWHVGFRDVPNFNHAFKRRFGMSPREFRIRADQDSRLHQDFADRTNEFGFAPMAETGLRAHR
jgi:AraC family transcriptional regulator of arabinose operon